MEINKIIKILILAIVIFNLITNCCQEQLDNNLQIACLLGNLEIFQESIEKKANINSTSYSFRNTPLHNACESGFFNICALLIQNGANVNAVNDFEKTPLHLACYRKTYVENFNLSDAVELPENINTLECFFKNTRLSICKLLIENGANINAIDIYGNTSLHLAAKTGNTEICELILNSNNK